MTEAAEFTEDWYSHEQGAFIADLYGDVKELEGLCIEIGCWEGKSTIYLANACYPEVLVCNDTWEGNVAEGEVMGVLHITVSLAAERDVFGRFSSNMARCTKGNYRVVKQDCQEWLPTVREPVKFCHIDASHDYQSVADSIRFLLPWVVEGGVLCGDDFLTANSGRQDLNGGVERAVRELLPGFLSRGNLWYWKKPRSSTDPPVSKE